MIDGIYEKHNNNEHILEAYSKAERTLMNLYYITGKRKYEKAALKISAEERKEHEKYESRNLCD